MSRKEIKPQSRRQARATTALPTSGLATNVQRVLAAVQQIPRGRVSTYGVIADLAGLPRRSRFVGTVLRQTPSARKLPWFRVINASGRSSFPVGSDAHELQYARLEAEGIEHVRGRIDLARYGWPAERFETSNTLDAYLWKIGD